MQNTVILKSFASIFIAAASALFLVSCEKKGPAEKAGEEIDDKVEDVKDKSEDAVDKAEDAVDELKK